MNTEIPTGKGKLKRKSEYQAVTDRVSLLSMAGNLVLTVFKFTAGIAGHSSAMTGDAAHSASDILGSLITMLGVRAAEKEADRDHPFGHERLESAASLMLAFILLLTGCGIIESALGKITSGIYETEDAPGRIALVAAVVSIVVKEAMYWYASYYAKKMNSVSLRAQAWDHRSDALSSVGALIGIAGARMGWPVLDPVAGFLIGLVIIKAAAQVFVDSVKGMTDQSCDASLEEEIRMFTETFDGIRSIDMLRTRIFGQRVYVELEVGIQADLTLEEAHRIAESLHDGLEDRFVEIKHVMIHMNPVNSAVQNSAVQAGQI